MDKMMEQIKILQGISKYTNREMAEEIGISRVMYSYFIRGVWMPGVPTIKKILKAYPGLLPYVVEDLTHG